ncbi:type II toxin-antitoxin system VapC family toxin [Euzebya tangerina]|uniref:type II toxin-antitoxin system VapC family toxin n=1 Tax=Euzebya tangerina TaxID=591198 RepID=UPI0039C85E75
MLVYAHRSDSPLHAQSAAVVKRLAEGEGRWAIPWPCIHEFYSTVTHARIYDPPSSPSQAADQLDAWVGSPTLRLLGEGRDHLRRLVDLAMAADVSGPRIHDARIAAICISHGVDHLVTLDRDFSRFQGLSLRSPLDLAD